MKKNLKSLNKLEKDICNLSKAVHIFLPEKIKILKELKRLSLKTEEMKSEIELFSSRFSDLGWCSYDSMKYSLVHKINEAYEKEGYDEAEQILLNYYIQDVKDILYTLKSNIEFLKRYDLIEIAFKNHFEKNYFSSVPLFLIIIDGAVNDFTKSKGFFAEGTDTTAWDCIVGCSDSLDKVKNIFTHTRKKTTEEMIIMPFRNGILHGRDLNFGNKYVSCKCVSLLFAISDWLVLKGNEVERKQKFEKTKEPVDIKATLNDINEIKEDKREIKEWKPRKIIVGKTIKKFGVKEDYNEYDYFEIIFDLFEYWKNKNYGKLSLLLKDMFSSEKNKKLHPKMCRDFFEEKDFQSFEFLEVEERGCCLTRVLVETKWKIDVKEYCEPLEFGCIYQNDTKEIALPWKNNGEWRIKTWKTNGLYKI